MGGSCICWTWALWFCSKENQHQIRSTISCEHLHETPVCSWGEKPEIFCSSCVYQGQLGQCRCVQGTGQHEAITGSLRFAKMLQDDEVNLFFQHLQGWGLSPGELQCLTTLSVEKFSLMPNLELPWHSLRPFPWLCGWLVVSRGQPHLAEISF